MKNTIKELQSDIGDINKLDKQLKTASTLNQFEVIVANRSLETIAKYYGCSLSFKVNNKTTIYDGLMGFDLNRRWIDYKLRDCIHSIRMRNASKREKALVDKAIKQKNLGKLNPQEYTYKRKKK